MSVLMLTAWLAACPIPSQWVRALAEVESGNNPRAVGRHGERTAYQITPRVWRSMSSKPIEQAGPNEVRGEVHEEWCRRADRFRARYGRAPTPPEAYLLWHRPARVRSPRPLERERAERFRNIVEAYGR